MRPHLKTVFPRSRAALFGAAVLAFAGPVSADTALLLINARYEVAQNLRETRDVAQLRTPLEEAGFETIVVRNGDGAALQAGLDALLQADERDRVLVVATGHFLRSGSDGWLVGVEADSPSLATIGARGLSLAAVQEVAARAPGRAIVMLAEERRRIDPGAGLGIGIGAITPPNGVTVVTGRSEDLAEFTTEVLLRPGADLAVELAESRRLRGFGFVSHAVAFTQAQPTQALALPIAPPPAPGGPSPAEQALWDAAIELGTAGAYRAYLDRYPRGRFAAEASERITAIENDPIARAETTEEALDLNRDQRRQIQRSLSILGYDTRGIDGIFGSGTRGAISNWQEASGFVATGYLSAAEIDVLGQQAAVRTAELEAEARAARAAEERADRAYWQITGQGASEAGLRDYLARFPDGLFAEEAERRLAQIDAATRAQAEARDRADWDVARGQDSVRAYRDYLANNPGGAFRAQAESRIAALQGTGGGGNGPSPDVIARLEQREAALNLPPVTRSLIEQRLAALGLEPGRVDGRFTDETRRAIRRYQRARDLEVTGYLDQPSVVRLLAETVGGILQLNGVNR